MGTIKKITSAVAATVLVVMVVVISFAFKASDNKKGKLISNPVTFYYNGDALADPKIETNYGSSPVFTCDDVEEVPCQITFDQDLYLLPATKTPLQNYLDSKTPAQLLQDAISVRSN